MQDIHAIDATNKMVLSKTWLAQKVVIIIQRGKKNKLQLANFFKERLKEVPAVLQTEGGFVSVGLSLPTSHVLVVDGGVGTLAGLL